MHAIFRKVFTKTKFIGIWNCIDNECMIQYNVNMQWCSEDIPVPLFYYVKGGKYKNASDS